MKNKSSKKYLVSFREAISIGEYDPVYLANYPEWHTFSNYQKLQYIREAIDNRKKNLTIQMAELYNVLDFRNKPELLKAVENIQEHIRKIESDRERLYLEFSEGL